MNKLSILIIFCTICLTGLSQDFQGTIIYSVEYRNPLSGTISDSTFNEKYEKKKTLIYLFKDDKYKVIEKEINRVLIYVPKKNRIYDYTEGNNSAIWVETMSQLNETIEKKKSDETEKINGIDCECFILNTSIGELKYYFSNNFKFESTKFKGHKFGIWEDYLKETGVIPLKCVIRNAFLYEILTFVEIKEEVLSDDLFVLPKFKHLTKFPNKNNDYQ